MASTELTEARREEIEELIRAAKTHTKNLRLVGLTDHAQLLDDLAAVAEEYLEEVK